MEQFLRLPRDERHLYFVQTAERLAFAEVLRVLGKWETHFNRGA